MLSIALTAIGGGAVLGTGGYFLWRAKRNVEGEPAPPVELPPAPPVRVVLVEPTAPPPASPLAPARAPDAPAWTPPVFTAPAATTASTGDSGIPPTSDEIEALARVIASEAGSGSLAEQRAIGWTVRNRFRGSSIYDGPGAGGAEGEYPWRDQKGRKPPFSSARPASDTHRQIARQILSAKQADDPTGGATSFFEPKMQDVFAKAGALARAGETGSRTIDGVKLSDITRFKNYTKDADAVRARWGKGSTLYANAGRFEFWGSAKLFADRGGAVQTIVGKLRQEVVVGLDALGALLVNPAAAAPVAAPARPDPSRMRQAVGQLLDILGQMTEADGADPIARMLDETAPDPTAMPNDVAPADDTEIMEDAIWRDTYSASIDPESLTVDDLEVAEAAQEATSWEEYESPEAFSPEAPDPGMPGGPVSYASPPPYYTPPTAMPDLSIPPPPAPAADVPPPSTPPPSVSDTTLSIAPPGTPPPSLTTPTTMDVSLAPPSAPKQVVLMDRLTPEAQRRLERAVTQAAPPQPDTERRLAGKAPARSTSHARTFKPAALPLTKTLALKEKKRIPTPVLHGDAGYSDADRDAVARAIDACRPHGTIEEKQAVAWVCRNLARKIGGSLEKIIGRRFLPTARGTSEDSRKVASAVLALLASSDPTGGALDFFCPAETDYLHLAHQAHRAAVVSGDDRAAAALEFAADADASSDEARAVREASGMVCLGAVGDVEFWGF